MSKGKFEKSQTANNIYIVSIISENSFVFSFYRVVVSVRLSVFGSVCSFFVMLIPPVQCECRDTYLHAEIFAAVCVGAYRAWTEHNDFGAPVTRPSVPAMRFRAISAVCWCLIRSSSGACCAGWRGYHL